MGGILFSAQREHEERKLKFYGNLVSNIAFDRNIFRDQANQLILMMQQYKVLHKKEQKKTFQLTNIGEFQNIQERVESYE